MAAVAALHILLVAGLVSVLGHRQVTLPPDHLQVNLVRDEPTKRDEVKPPPPQLDAPPPPPFVPVPEGAVSVTPSLTTAIVAAPAAHPATVEAPPAPRQVRVDPRLDDRRSEDPVYPPIARRMGEEGIVTLLVIIGTDGSVQDVKVEKSSGHQRLDDAAIDGARRRCRFSPGSVDGRPQAMWYRYRYQFKLS
jgi:protein TonB